MKIEGEGLSIASMTLQNPGKSERRTMCGFIRHDVSEETSTKEPAYSVKLPAPGRLPSLGLNSRLGGLCELGR